MLQLRTIVVDALSKIGAINFGENPDTHTTGLVVREFQRIIDEWAIRFNNYKQYDKSTSAKSSITLGTDTSNILVPVSGDIAQRPATISNVNYITGGLTYPLSIKTHEEYSQLSLKTVFGIPDTAYVEYGYPYITIYFYPFPSQIGTIQIIGKDYMVPEQIMLNDYVEIPREYNAALVSLLALRIAPYFGVTAGPDLIAQAASDSKHIRTMNFTRAITTNTSDWDNNNGTNNILGRR
jgi:hypothetical protein